ncbi:(d)CMP kinase [Desulfolucanica intricata]|uniref:(d)CMP kinase n=1 Tax=Desulfolucanica intricata TaxID=1285191 RepID=UPI0008362F7B|nr:(d)CMP kinase [Desulfolucanica intricata]
MAGKINIAIDGPAGAGKSTVAKDIARRLGLIYIDTGAMYRALTLMALKCELDLDNEDILTKLANSIKIEFINDPVTGGGRILLNGEDVSDAVRNPEISRHVSRVAKVPGVRNRMAKIQQSMAINGGVVMEGRDIGIKVLPQADYKFFLTASARERARRRYIELINQGYQVDMEQLVQEIKERDFCDSTRAVDPLTPAEDAEIIDCTTMSLDQVVMYILSRVELRR